MYPPLPPPINASTVPELFFHSCKLPCPDAATIVIGTAAEDVDITLAVPNLVVPADAVKLPANVPVEAENIPEELDKAEEETVNGPKVPEVNVTTPEILAELEVKVPAGVT
jgi:hypothetical protein